MACSASIAVANYSIRGDSHGDRTIEVCSAVTTSVVSVRRQQPSSSWALVHPQTPSLHQSVLPLSLQPFSSPFPLQRSFTRLYSLVALLYARPVAMDTLGRILAGTALCLLFLVLQCQAQSVHGFNWGFTVRSPSIAFERLQPDMWTS